MQRHAFDGHGHFVPSPTAMDSQMSNDDRQVSDSWLLDAVQAIAISPEDAKASAEQRLRLIRAKYPKLDNNDVQDFAADAIVKNYARYAASVGVATGATGIIPGLGTAVAAIGGAAVDGAACMKIQVDMTMILAAIYGYDILNPDAQRLAFLIASTGALNKAGTQGAVILGGKAGVNMLRQYLKGAALQAIKQFFKKLGLVFTRKALEKALPFGIGMAVGGGANYALTRYVGNQARDWFIIDRSDGGPAVTLGQRA